MSDCLPSACKSCPASGWADSRLRSQNCDFIIALAGNPNTGKSTLFNALTGLRQHTGNWPGKTVSRAEGRFKHREKTFLIVDLPGSYSLEGVSSDETVTASFLASGHADATIVVLDATALERNLAFVLQVIERSPHTVVALNLMDEARAKGLVIDVKALSASLGRPVLPIVARRGVGLENLKDALLETASQTEQADFRSSTATQQSPHSYHERASEIAAACLERTGKDHRRWQEHLDHWLTHPLTGFPLMGLAMALVLWITIQGANVPSAYIGSLLLDTVHPWFRETLLGLGTPNWFVGLSIDGVYLTLAWVVSVMLPPMAIFFPLFTLLEDFGYLPRVAFNLDPFFQRSGAHGKQALTMAMGYGCNAAGIIATRIIESPRERLVAILTNNFALCNGRWPMQILIASVFLGSLVPPALSGIVAAGAVFGVSLLGVVLTFLVSWGLSRSILKGESSAFSLELPPLRPPDFWKTLYTSIIDRTLFVLWRAMVFAAPAGAVIWLCSNITISDTSLASYAIDLLDPLGVFIGLNGVILFAYVIAIPANEIVIPTILMLTVMTTGYSIDTWAGQGVLFETGDAHILLPLLSAGGWTTLTAVCLMLFSLCHNPCSTTLYTIYKETGSWRWTAWAAIIPTALGLLICGALATVWRLFS